jgi:hypothetical protein
MKVKILNIILKKKLLKFQNHLEEEPVAVEWVKAVQEVEVLIEVF